MPTTPIVSVILPAFNAQAYLAEAIESILAQTIGNLELIIVDDGSTDNTPFVIDEFIDPRINVIRNQVNTGIVASLNTAIAIAKGEFIARMDADDISNSKRLEFQLRVMSNNPEIDILGTGAELLEKSKHTGKILYPRSHDEIAISLLLHEKAICHPSILARAKILKNNPYRDIKFAEDFDLWTRLIPRYRFSNIEQCLITYRLHERQTGSIHYLEQGNNSVEIAMSKLRLFGILRENDIALHRQLLYPSSSSDPKLSLKQLVLWTNKLAELNSSGPKFNEKLFKGYLIKKLARWIIAQRTPLLLQRAQLAAKIVTSNTSPHIILSVLRILLILDTSKSLRK